MIDDNVNDNVNDEYYIEPGMSDDEIKKIADEYQDLIHGRLNNKDIILIEDNIEDVIKDIYNAIGYQVTAMKIKNSVIEAFQHPISQQIIECAPGYNDRKYVCNKLNNLSM
jgi:hypothetical protein